MKKIMTSLGLVLAVGAVAVGATSCGPKEVPFADRTIEVLVQTADHGWTGAVRQYAEEKVAEITKAGKYKINLTANEKPVDEANKIADLLTKKEALHGIVMLPLDNTLENSIVNIANEGVNFVQFDRVISNKVIDNAKSRVANVLGDNYGIGKATAETFVAKGITKDDKVLIMPGDNSSVPISRTKGFKETLAAKLNITAKEVDAMCTETPYTDWSRATARKIFTDLGNKVCDYQWIFTHDSEIAMGILEELKGSVVTPEVKTHFKDGSLKSLASSSGLDEMYAVLENKHTGNYNEVLSEDTYLFDVTYDPAMIKIAIQSMVDFLDGKEVTKNNVVPVHVVDKANVTEYKGFGGGDYRK